MKFTQKLIIVLAIITGFRSDLTFFIIFTIGASVNIFSMLCCFLLANYFPCANFLLVAFVHVLLEQYPLSGCVIAK